MRYLENPPSREVFDRLLFQLGPELVRKGEDVYLELELQNATREQLLDALVAHPVLMERPVAVLGERAVIGRPNERVLDLLDGI